MQNKKILMCGSRLDVRGGMVSVIKNYLNYNDWGKYNIVYVPTHVESSKVSVALYFLLAYIKIIILCMTDKIEIAYFHTAERGSFFRKAILVRTMRLFKVKTVMHHHAAEFDHFYENLSETKQKFVNKTLEMVDLNIVLSERLVSMITDKVEKATVKVLYNAVSTYDVNRYNKEACNILFLGRLGERKGTYDLLKAIKELHEKLPTDVHFYLCGDGDIDIVKSKILEYGIFNRVDHVGWIDGAKKEEFMANTKINVLPSYHEGLPMTILETMAYGIPNICTNIASIPEVISNGENGFLIDPGDVEQLKKYIMILCENHELCENISEKSWQDIGNKFSLSVHIEKLKKYLDII